MSKPQTIIDKIYDRHIVSQKKGHPAVFAIDLQLIHEVTSPQGFDMLRERGLRFAQPDHHIATLDHAIPTRKDRIIIHDPPAKKMVEKLRTNVKEFGVPMFDYDSGHQGIVHAIGPELGITQPGLTIVCGDSHTSTHGAFGALAFGVGTSEVGMVMATGCLLQNKPKIMRVTFEGSLQRGVYAKDMILALIAQEGVRGGQGYIVEYDGSMIHSMTMEERMTICNMTIEWGARSGLVAPDEITFNYIKGRTYAPKDTEWDKAIKQWKSLCSDEGAVFDKEVKINVDQLEPIVTWGTSPGQGVAISGKIPMCGATMSSRAKPALSLPLDHELGVEWSKCRGTNHGTGSDVALRQAQGDMQKKAQGDMQKKAQGDMQKKAQGDTQTIKAALEYVQLEEGQPIAGVPIQWAFLGSCTNARLSDLRVAAEIMKGKKVADGVTMLVVPASEPVKVAAEAEGLDTIFEEAGAKWRNPGCSACLGMNDDKIPAGERCISTSNRNFIGRQGPGSITHLASPATVAASAMAGSISDPRVNM